MMADRREAAQAAPFREAKLMPVDLEMETRPDGTILLASRIPLRAYDHNIPQAFAKRAALMGEKSALARRGPDGEWARTSYAELQRAIEGAAQWMLSLEREGPVLILAPNSPGFAAMTFAAYASGRPAAPVSATYAQLGGDFGRLAYVIGKVKPAVIFAEDTRAAAAALERLDLGGAVIVTADPGLLSKPALALAEVCATTPTPAVAARAAEIKPDDIASLMLTSGSTGLPKVVPISFGNLTANSTQAQQAIGAAAGWHEEMLDWLPWHHAAGAFVYRTTLLEGGTLYIDDGKPAPGLFDATLRNLREISVSYFNNVPLGYQMLVDALETDPDLRRTFFKKMRLMLYGGAGLSQSVHDRLQALAIAETGCRILMTSGYGMTEAVSGFMVIHFETDKVGIGLPTPGVRLKLVPRDGRYELRCKGPNVTRGYLDDPEKTAAAFDEEGYYRTGDLCVFHDPDDPGQGLAFAGRAAEEFKLSSGTWVYGGALRDGLMRGLGAHALDVVLCDDDRPYLTALVWPKPGASREAIAGAIAAFNAGQHGSASSIRRALLLVDPPSANGHEISDKGTLNRRAVIDRRAGEVARLYADAPDSDVMVFD